MKRKLVVEGLSKSMQELVLTSCLVPHMVCLFFFTILLFLVANRRRDVTKNHDTVVEDVRPVSALPLIVMMTAVVVRRPSTIDKQRLTNKNAMLSEYRST